MRANKNQDNTIERLITITLDLGQQLLEFLSRTQTLKQLLIVAFILLAARLLAKYLEPRLERRIRAMRQPKKWMLRVLSLLLRRMTWIFFAAGTATALLLARETGFPGSEYLIYLALLLALAWVGIALVSRLIHNRALSAVVAGAVWAYVALVLLGIDDDMGRLLDAAGFSIGGFRLSLLLVIKMLVFMGALLWGAVALGNFLENRLQSLEDFSPSLRVLLGKVVKITLIVIAVLVGIASLGIDLTIFAVFSGAIGVGLGFGLQKVVSNFISGIIILMDRSIKPGDTITLGETFGWIRELRARFVSVVTRDGREYLIPNEDFITHEVVNWSFSDQLVRLDVEFGVSYDSDPHEVIALAIETAQECSRVYAGRKPVCWLTAFGDSSLNFIVRFWISDPRQGLTNIRGVVLLALWDAFKERGIGIPFPHREIILKDGALPVVEKPAPE